MTPSVPKDTTGKTRWCHSCGAFRPTSEFSVVDLHAYCRPHLLEYYRTKNRRWELNNPGDTARRCRERYWADPEEARRKVRKKHKKWLSHNRERSNAYHRKWRKENPEKVRAAQRKRCIRLTATGGHKKKYRKWKEADPERARQVWRAQYKKKYTRDPQYFYYRWLNRKAKNAKAAGVCTREAADRVFSKFAGICLYCARLATEHDHIVSLDKGGTNFPWNIGPACRYCNAGKGAKEPLLFIQEKKMRLSAKRYVRSAVRKHNRFIKENRHG